MENWEKSPQGWYRHRKNLRRGGLFCPFCGFCCVSLGSHLFHEHLITAFEFRKNNGFTKKHQLTCNELHDVFVNNGKKIGGKINTKKRIRELGKQRKGRFGMIIYSLQEGKNIHSRCAKKNLIAFQHLGRTSELAKKRYLKYPYLAKHNGDILNNPENRRKAIQSLKKYLNTNNRIKNIIAPFYCTLKQPNRYEG